MNWGYLYWRAYEDGHNHRGLRGHQLDEYAKAYADTFEDRASCSLHAFWADWRAGHIVPRPSGAYHYDPNAVLHTYHEENGRVVAA